MFGKQHNSQVFLSSKLIVKTNTLAKQKEIRVESIVKVNYSLNCSLNALKYY